MFSDEFALFAQKMTERGLRPAQISAFKYNYERYLAGDTGLLSQREIEAVEALPELEALPHPVDGERGLLSRLAILKLNGGLGTSMGLRGPKSLVPLCQGKNFLDVLVQQVEHYRRQWRVQCPLILMNSFNTSAETRAYLERYPNLADQCVPLELLQSQVPKIEVATNRPALWVESRELEWCPPGHGDVYSSLYHTGMLAKLLQAGFKYLFLSNIDNLGAVVDERILTYMEKYQIDFIMETAVRSAMDRKGGHLARRKEGGLVLREAAMCPADEMEQFQNIQLYRHFNTNNLWVNLLSLRAQMEKHDGMLPLPLIVNRKKIDSRDPNSTPVVQLETAMGAAISLFDNVQALEVPRQRFAPVKTVADLLALRSDAFELSESGQMRLRAPRTMPPVVSLDSSVKLVSDLDRIIPYGAPSLLECRSLSIRGLVTFGKNVCCRGEVSVKAERPLYIEDGAVLEG